MDGGRMPKATDLAAALMLLGRIPLPARLTRGGITAAAAWAFPLAGAVLILPPAAVGWLLLTLGIPAPLTALVVLAAAAVVTGALHEDGLADVADGFWGGRDRARRLEIMRDSRIGSYGVLALILVTALRWQALALILGAGTLWAPLIATAALSRAAMVPVMAALPHARPDGLASSVGRPAPAHAAIAVAIAALLVLVLLPWRYALAALVLAALALLALAALARAKVGGQTGDVLGATQQVAEAAILVSLAA